MCYNSQVKLIKFKSTTPVMPLVIFNKRRLHSYLYRSICNRCVMFSILHAPPSLSLPLFLVLNLGWVDWSTSICFSNPKQLFFLKNCLSLHVIQKLTNMACYGCLDTDDEIWGLISLLKEDLWRNIKRNTINHNYIIDELYLTKKFHFYRANGLVKVTTHRGQLSGLQSKV